MKIYETLQIHQCNIESNLTGSEIHQKLHSISHSIGNTKIGTKESKYIEAKRCNANNEERESIEKEKAKVSLKTEITCTL